MVDWKKEYLKSNIIIFSLIWGIVSVLLYEWIEKIIIWIDTAMQWLTQGFLIIIATPGYFVNKVVAKFMSIQNVYVQLVIGVLFAWLIAPYILKVFKWIFKILFNKPLPSWLGG